MKRMVLVASAVATLTAGWLTLPYVRGQVPHVNEADADDSPPPVAQGGVARRAGPASHFPDFATVTRGTKEHEGLFRLWSKDDAVFMEIRPDQFNKPFLCPIAVARGGGIGGQTLNFDEQWILLFKRVGDKVQLIRRDVHHKAKPGTPLAKAVETTYSDSVLMALRIATMNPQRGTVVVNLNDIFLTDFAELDLGYFDANRSSWSKVKTFPRNIELQVQATFGGGRTSRSGGDSVIDPRGNTVVIHYGLCDLPDGGYHPRAADDRVGYFLSAVKDYSSDGKDSNFVRYVNRWRLERAEGGDVKKLSVPKKSIKFYIEKTVPHEYRAAVQDGILEWNKAFERVGFRNAIEVVQQRDDDDFDPEDMNYNTIRWITTDSAFAMGPSRANPMTGEILDADIIFDADLIKMWKLERKVLGGAAGANMEPASPIQAMDLGWGLDHPLIRRRSPQALGWNEAPRRAVDDPTAARLWAIRQGVCQCGSYMGYELGLAAMAMMNRGQAKSTDKLPDEMINQAIKEVVMHEVGHTLGLRHNFKGSTMLPNDQLHDTKITREKGLTGSVMDYTPVNLAPKGTKQGDYFTTTIGPYDYWAIEYAYKPISGDESEELKKIANRVAKAGHDYGTDEDTFLTADPNINRWDLGGDVMKFAQDRITLAEELIKDLPAKVVDEGEGYQRARAALGIILAQYGNGAYLISKYVGGEHAYRDHRGDPDGRDPLVPVTAARQRAALRFLQEHVLNDKSFQFPPELLRRMAAERWYHWGATPSSTDFPVYDRVLSIQKVAMNQLLSPAVLKRIQANSLKTPKDEKPLALSEVFKAVTDGVWSDMPNGNGPAPDKANSTSVVRRNLQREHVKKLSSMVLGPKSSGDDILMILLGGGGGADVPPDARSLARQHLRDLNKRIGAMIGDRQANVDETTMAHLEECRERIAKVLDASIQVND